MLTRQFTTSTRLLKRAAPSTLPARLAAVSSSPPPEVFSSDEISDRKSRFVGHAAKVKTLEEVRGFVEEILADKRNKRASHPAMLAWRLEDDSGHDDDGESGAGRVLLSLLESTDARGAVAVTRWYGGTPLGPARFRHIGAAGREALLRAGIIKK